MQQLFQWSIKNHVTLRVKFIPGCINTMADLLSQKGQIINAQFSLCRIYCRTWMNWPFLFGQGIIPGHSSQSLSIRIVYFSFVTLAGQHESFKHVQNFRVPNANTFLPGYYAHWKRIVFFFVAQLTYCILIIFTVFVLYSGCSNCIPHYSYM